MSSFKDVRSFFDKLSDKYTDIGLWPSENYLINKYVRKGSKILEIGCGTGRTAIPLALKGFNVTGIDISKKMLENAEKNAKKLKADRAHFVLADASDLPFKDKSFDVVFIPYCSLDYVYPLDKRELAIDEMARVSKKGSILIHSFHNVVSIHGNFRFWFWTPYILGYWLYKKRIDGGYLPVTGGIPEFYTTIGEELKRFKLRGFSHLETVFGKLGKPKLFGLKRGSVIISMKKISN